MGRQYEAVSTIEVGKMDQSETSLRVNAAPAPPSPDEIKTDIATHMAVLQSANVLLGVVRDLKLQQEAPFAFKPTLMGAISGTNAHIEDEIKRGLPLEQAPYSRDRILAIFSKKLKIEKHSRHAAHYGGISESERGSRSRDRQRHRAGVCNLRSQAAGLLRCPALAGGPVGRPEGQLRNLAGRTPAAFEQKTGLNGMVLGALNESGGGTTHVPALDSLDSLNQQLIAAQTDRIAKEAVYRLTETQDP